MRLAPALLCALLLLAGAPGCGPERRPPLPVARAPGEVATLTIHVLNASHSASQAAHENVNGYSIELRALIQQVLIRAGYTVIVDRSMPHDAEALVVFDGGGLGRPGAATLTLTSEGRLVAQVSASVGIDEHANLEERGAVDLVERLSRQPALVELARQRPSAKTKVQEVAAPR
jgi:hypothetical protein